MTCHNSKKFLFYTLSCLDNIYPTAAYASITKVHLFTQRGATELWLTRLLTEDLEERQHAEWSYHVQLQHHEVLIFNGSKV